MSSSATTESSKSTANKHQASTNGNSQFVALIAFGLVAVLIACSHTLTSAFAQNLAEKASAFGETTAVVASTTLSSNAAEPQSSFQLALDDSFGFFDDVPDEKWLIRKRISNERKRIHIPVPVREADIRKPQGIYQANWNPDFSCEFEDFVGPGGDGGKWICDPHRISQENCIVYSIGSNGKFDFEEHVNLVLPQCEVHIFDFTNYEQKMLNEGKVNASFHAWGIKGNDGTVNAHAKRAKNMKSMKETVQDLGHVGRRIDIFKIDCEGCEVCALHRCSGDLLASLCGSVMHPSCISTRCAVVVASL